LRDEASNFKKILLRLTPVVLCLAFHLTGVISHLPDGLIEMVVVQ